MVDETGVTCPAYRNSIKARPPFLGNLHPRASPGLGWGPAASPSKHALGREGHQFFIHCPSSRSSLKSLLFHWWRAYDFDLFIITSRESHEEEQVKPRGSQTTLNRGLNESSSVSPSLHLFHCCLLSILAVKTLQKVRGWVRLALYLAWNYSLLSRET